MSVWIQNVKFIFQDLISVIRKKKVPLFASSLAFTTVLSLVPLLAVSFSIFKSFGGLDKLYSLLEPVILANLTEGATSSAQQSIRSFMNNIHAGKIGAGGLVALIFSCMSMFASAERAIHEIWNTPHERSLYSRISSYWLLITLGPLAAAVFLGAASTKLFSSSDWTLPTSFGPFLLSFIGISFFYKFVPNTKVSTKISLLCGGIVSFFWFGAKGMYAFYTQNILSYNKIYGGLAAFPIILIWIYLSWFIILTGSALGFCIQNHFLKKEP